MAERRFVVHHDHGEIGYTCGYCNIAVAGLVVAHYPNIGRPDTVWVLCPSCDRGSVIVRGTVCPQPLMGSPVDGLPPGLCEIYDEAKKSFSTGSYTACELLCRKILMHVAVNKGADENQKFVQYVDYLEQQHYITHHNKKWADLVRENGNHAAHEIAPPSKERAESTLEFTAYLLKTVYEMAQREKEFTGGKN